MAKQKQRCTASVTRRGLAPLFPLEMYKLGNALFEQQMWCWGCDVRREAGNLLLAYGLDKQPSPQPRYHSAYTSPLGADGTITLWGWGLWVAIHNYGSAFVSRSNFRIRYAHDAQLRPAAWCESHLPPFDAVVNQTSIAHLLATAFDWIANYERWLASVVDVEYRDRALAAWTQRRRYRGGVPVADVPNRWMQLAQIAANSNTNTAHIS